MRSGDRCLVCGLGSMKVFSVRTRGLSRTRYLRCTHCQATGKEILKVDHLGRQLFIFDLVATPSTEITTRHAMPTGQ